MGIKVRYLYTMDYIYAFMVIMGDNDKWWGQLNFWNTEIREIYGKQSLGEDRALPL